MIKILSYQSDEWWDTLTKNQQEEYLKLHPKSKRKVKTEGPSAPVKTLNESDRIFKPTRIGAYETSIQDETVRSVLKALVSDIGEVADHKTDGDNSSWRFNLNDHPNAIDALDDLLEEARSHKSKIWYDVTTNKDVKTLISLDGTTAIQWNNMTCAIKTSKVENPYATKVPLKSYLHPLMKVLDQAQYETETGDDHITFKGKMPSELSDLVRKQLDSDPIWENTGDGEDTYIYNNITIDGSNTFYFSGGTFYLLLNRIVSQPKSVLEVEKLNKKKRAAETPLVFKLDEKPEPRKAGTALVQHVWKDTAPGELKARVVSNLTRSVNEELKRQNTYIPSNHYESTYDFVNAIIGAWAESSTSPLSARIQKTVARMFSTNPKIIGSEESVVLQGWGDENEKMEKATEIVLAEMYKQTQALFKENGITHLYLQRGFDPKEAIVAKLSQGKYKRLGKYKIQLNPLSSFSASPTTSSAFGTHIIHMKVPAERIFTSTLTGIGCLKEQEYVVLGNKKPETAYITDTKQPDSRFYVNEPWELIEKNKQVAHLMRLALSRLN